jgi:uroporphyrinogen-III synthase
VAAVGPGTAAALRDRHLVADLVPERAVAESLVDAFPEGPGRVLLPQAAAARPVLATGLASKGWDVDVVEAYRTVPVAAPPAAREAAARADAITFTSASTVSGFLDAVGPGGLPPVVVSIGPITSARARESGVAVHAEASPHTVEGLVDEVVRVLGRA